MQHIRQKHRPMAGPQTHVLVVSIREMAIGHALPKMRPRCEYDAGRLLETSFRNLQDTTSEYTYGKSHLLTAGQNSMEVTLTSRSSSMLRHPCYARIPMMKKPSASRFVWMLCVSCSDSSTASEKVTVTKQATLSLARE